MLIAIAFVALLYSSHPNKILFFLCAADPKKRSDNPEFYGYNPNSAAKRTMIFISMLLLGSVMLFTRALILVMLGLVSQTAALVYLCFDMGLYLVFKLVRGDFYYWLPLDGFLGFVVSLIIRVIAKVIVDYTSNPHFRHTYEVGGAYWAFGFVLTLACLPLTVLFYEKTGGNENVAQIGWNSTLFLIPCALMLMAAFITNIKREYRHTFYGLARGKDVTLSYFKSNEDRRKILVFKNNYRHWREIDGKVEKWVRENWERWMEEEPEWLDENMRNRIPPRMIPNQLEEKESQLERKMSSLKGRRRSSLKGRRRSSSCKAAKVSPQQSIVEKDTVRNND